MLFKNLFILIFLIQSCISKEQYDNLLPNTRRITRFPMNCINKLVKDNFKCGSHMSILYTEAVNDQVSVLTEALSKHGCYSIITRNYLEMDQLISWSQIYITLASDIVEYTAGIDQLLKDSLWNPKARYVVYISKLRSITDLFNMLLKHNIFNAVLIKRSDTGGSIFTYYAFNNSNCGQKFDKVVKLGDCFNETAIVNCFTNKIPDEFPNCTLRAAIHEEVPNIILDTENYTMLGKPILGLEQFILKLATQIEGINLEFIPSYKEELRNGIVLENGTSTGMMAYLEKHEADLVAAGMNLMRNRAEWYDFIWGYDYGLFTVFRQARPENDWTMVYKEFGKRTWILVASFYCIFMIAFLIIATFIRKLKEDRGSLPLKLWGYFFANTNQNLSKKKHLRGLLACWIWFAFFIANFYNTGFYSLMTGRVRVKEHSHSTTLRTSNLKPCISATVRDLFYVMYNKTWPVDSKLNCKNSTMALTTTAKTGGDIYTIDMQHNYYKQEDKFIDDDGTHLLELWEYSKGTTTVAMYLSRGFPMKDVLQTQLRYIVETGLLQYQKSIIMLKTNKAVSAKRRQFKLLDMAGARVAFIILGSGLGMALLSFFIELVKSK